MKNESRAYTLPKRLLRRALPVLARIENLDIRSAANALLHLAGRYHTAPGTYGRHFFLCRKSLVEHPEMKGHSEWHIRRGIEEIEKLKFLRCVFRAKKAKRRVGGYRKAPTLFVFHPFWACYFPEALKPRFRRPHPPPVCRKTSQNLDLELNLETGVHTGELDRKPPVTEKPQTKPTAFDGAMDAILARVMAHVRP